MHGRPMVSCRRDSTVAKRLNLNSTPYYILLFSLLLLLHTGRPTSRTSGQPKVHFGRIQETTPGSAATQQLIPDVNKSSDVDR
jgi:hypothetical protein